jgi:hypothetical protein
VVDSRGGKDNEINFKQDRSIFENGSLRVESVAVDRGWGVEFGGTGSIGHEASAVEFIIHFLKNVGSM